MIELSEQSIKVVRNGDGVTVTGHGRVVQINHIDVNVVTRLLTSDDLTLEEKNLLNRIMKELFPSKVWNEYKRSPYELGDKVLLVSNVCNQCLALHNPVCNLPRYPVPNWIMQRDYNNNMVLTLDSYGLNSLSVLSTISHAKCCPTEVVPFTDWYGERTIDETLMDLDLITRMLHKYHFYFDVLWTIEAYFLHGTKRFYGISKSDVIEKFLIYVLTQFYNYDGFFLGLSRKTAYLQYLNASDLVMEQGPLPQMIDCSSYPLVIALGMDDKLQSATFEELPSSLIHVRLTINNQYYHSISDSISQGIVDIYHKCGEDDRQEKKRIGTLDKLWQYHDGFTRKYNFCIIRGE